MKLALLLLFAGAGSARAHIESAAALRAGAAAMGVELPALGPLPETPPGVVIEESYVNFEYTDMVDRFESMSRTVIGRDKKKRRVDTGVTPADRVEAGEIKYIVLHASGGATGKPGACEGTVKWLARRATAAHFMVCRDGRVYQMVKIENIGNHVKNADIDKASVGIETESGHPKPARKTDPPVFDHDDWNPAKYWRMYASLAWLIRAIAKETGLPRDDAHVITHELADGPAMLPGRIKGERHVDPGPHFTGGFYPGFDALYPGESLTPYAWLMKLVGDDAPPQIWMLAASVPRDQVEVKDANGLAHVRVWRLDAAGKARDLKLDWSAPADALPPSSLTVAVPADAGDYRVVARDLVGNTSAALVKVPEPAAPASLAGPLSAE